MTGPQPVLEALHISKYFGEVTALDDVSLKLRPGSVHALLGENGAGKSTLVKCIMGYYRPSKGQLMVDGKEEIIASPQQATRFGIGMVYQHFTLIPNMTIAENIVLSRPALPAVIDWPAEIAKLEKKMEQMPFKFDLRRLVSTLSVGEKQKVEITKQLLLEARILILDEPTSVLTPTEADEVLDKIYQLTRSGSLSVLIITHKFREVTQYADDVTVLRKGRYIGSAKVSEVSTDSLAGMMVGEEFSHSPPVRESLNSATVSLQIDSLTIDNDQGMVAVKGLNLAIRSGEIVGIAGVSGNGQKQLVEALAGQRKPLHGTISAHGEGFHGKQAEMLKHRFFCLPEEPLRNACVGNLSIANNLVLRTFNRKPFSHFGWVLNQRAITKHARDIIAAYKIRTSGPDQPVASLSGGNVQRVVLARELNDPVSILVVANPCFGLDFKAVADIRSKILEARNRGAAILLLSEDLDEVLELSDRFYVISNGELVYETTPDVADLKTVGQYMAGH